MQQKSQLTNNLNNYAEANNTMDTN